MDSSFPVLAWLAAEDTEEALTQQYKSSSQSQYYPAHYKYSSSEVMQYWITLSISSNLVNIHNLELVLLSFHHLQLEQQ